MTGLELRSAAAPPSSVMNSQRVLLALVKNPAFAVGSVTPILTIVRRILGENTSQEKRHEFRIQVRDGTGRRSLVDLPVSALRGGAPQSTDSYAVVCPRG